MRCSRTRAALTLVELLVVIAIIGGLVAILLPAVQSARETARRSHCSSNLRQLGIAAHNYHDVHGVLPPAMIDSPNWPWADNPELVMNYPNAKSIGTSGFTLLLPFLEQTALYKQYDFRQPSGMTFNNFGFNPPFPAWSDYAINRPIILTSLSVLTCPSDEAPAGSLLKYAGGTNMTGTTGKEQNAAKSNYSFCTGGVPQNGNPYDHTQTHITNVLIAGPFGHNGASRLGDITDGLSNTVMFAEMKQATIGVYDASGNLGQGPMWGVSGPTSIDWVCQAGLPEEEPVFVGQVFAHIMGLPNSPSMLLETGLPDTTVQHAQGNTCSYHPGGVMICYCDGSVRFVSQTIRWEVWKYQNYCRDNMPSAAQ